MSILQPRFTVDGRGGSLVCITWSPSIVLEDTDGRSLTEELDRALPGRRAHLLMLLNGMASISQDALAFFARKASLSAIALVGPSVLDQTLIEMYLEIYRPPFPVGYFEREGDGRAWLVRQPLLAS